VRLDSIFGTAAQQLQQDLLASKERHAVPKMLETPGQMLGCLAGALRHFSDGR
jgi:hypothetical protein